MKLIVGGCALALIAMLVPFSSSPASELDEHLRFLEPLIGKEWVGGYVGSDSPGIEIVLRFETILGGRVVRYVREVEAADFSAVTQLYWNPGRGEVCFLGLNSRGIVEEGVVHVTDSKIVLRGKSQWPDRTIEFKTTLEIDAKGILRDTFLRMEGSQWVQGHVQEFIAKE